MIAIVNVSTHLAPIGVQQYELRINHQLIACFEHKREEGLTKCLERAAAAAEKAKWEGMRPLIEVMMGERPTSGGVTK